jgi:O-antigen/teichoic acid export membrane protein
MAGGGLPLAVAVLPIAAFGHLLGAYVLVTRKHGRPRLVTSRSSLRAALRTASPYALSELIGQVHWRTDVVLLGFFLGAAATGVYSVAYQVVYVLCAVPHFAGMAVFPVASRLYKQSSATLEALYRRTLNFAVLIGLPAAVGLCLIAPDLIDFVVGQSFSASAPLLRLLAALLFIESLQSIVMFFLTACDRQVEVTRSQWTATWVNVLGNVILIPTLGVMGAVVAAVTSEALLLILLERRLRKVLGWPQVGSRLAMSAVATASFCLPFAFLPSLPMGMVIPACVLLYSGTLVLFKDIRRSEVPTLMNLIKGELP